MQLRSAFSPAQQDIAGVERYAEPLGLGLEDPPRRLPQRGYLELGGLENHPGIDVSDANPGSRHFGTLRIGCSSFPLFTLLLTYPYSTLV